MDNTAAALSADLDLAHRLANAASAVTLGRFRGRLKHDRRADGSLVTDADLATEDELRRLLGLERPTDAVLGEERGQSGSGRRRWILDGIDGTVNFAAGTPDWGSQIALEVDGRVVVGVCDQPVHERRYWATRGGGAFRTDLSSGGHKGLAVTTANDLSSARSFVQPAEYLRDDRARQVAKAIAGASRVHPLLDHPALQVAAGDYELAVFLAAGPWDLAAPALIVEEAGGRFTDINGRYDLFSNSAVFSNGHVHDATVRVAALQRPQSSDAFVR